MAKIVLVNKKTKQEIDCGENYFIKVISGDTDSMCTIKASDEHGDLMIKATHNGNNGSRSRHAARLGHHFLVITPEKHAEPEDEEIFGAEYGCQNLAKLLNNNTALKNIEEALESVEGNGMLNQINKMKAVHDHMKALLLLFKERED